MSSDPHFDSFLKTDGLYGVRLLWRVWKDGPYQELRFVRDVLLARVPVREDNVFVLERAHRVVEIDLYDNQDHKRLPAIGGMVAGQIMATAEVRSNEWKDFEKVEQTAEALSKYITSRGWRRE